MFRLTPWLLVLGLVAFGLPACAPAMSNSPKPPSASSTMREYALIFRATRPVSPADLPTRNAAARDWAIALQTQGILRTASPLEDEGTVVTDRGAEPVVRSGALAAVLVVQALSIEEVVRLAEGHPGLAYGTEIEVRPVKPVPPTR